MQRPRTRHVWSWAAAGLASTALLAACGGGSATKASSSNTTVPAAPAASTGGGSGTGGTPPGAFGSVAAITGSQMEVQNQQSGQVTVIWTPSTVFTRIATVPASAVTPGECVTATGAQSAGTITARNVTISQPSSSGTCNLGRRIGAGTRPPGSVPNRSFPQGTRPGGAAAGLSFASGKVTSVSASDMVLSGFSFSGRAPGSTASTPPTSAQATTVTVNLSSSTTYTETQAAAAGNLAVGDCVTANGSTSSTGAVTASRIAITSTGGGSCTAGFARFGGGTANG